MIIIKLIIILNIEICKYLYSCEPLSCCRLFEGTGDGPLLPGHFHSSSETLLLASRASINVNISSGFKFHSF